MTKLYRDQVTGFPSAMCRDQYLGHKATARSGAVLSCCDGKNCKRILETAELNAWIEERDEADKKHEESGAEGVLVGRYTVKLCNGCKAKPRVHTVQGWSIQRSKGSDTLKQAVETPVEPEPSPETAVDPELVQRRQQQQQRMMQVAQQHQVMPPGYNTQFQQLKMGEKASYEKGAPYR
eukprot:COSAG01_NODE_28128_length_668_cov_1.325132_1_plen_178_part_10